MPDHSSTFCTKKRWFLLLFGLLQQMWFPIEIFWRGMNRGSVVMNLRPRFNVPSGNNSQDNVGRILILFDFERIVQSELGPMGTNFNWNITGNYWKKERCGWKTPDKWTQFFVCITIIDNICLYVNFPKILHPVISCNIRYIKVT